MSSHFPLARSVSSCVFSVLSVVGARRMCGSICGADNGVAIAEFGRAKTDWLSSALLPSHDTISPWHFQDCFTAGVQSLMPKWADEGEIVPLDGKTLRRSYDTGSGQAAIHMVHAWAIKNRLVLGPFHWEEALEEISIIPELLRVLGLKGCLVTTDALRARPNRSSNKRPTTCWPSRPINPNSTPISNRFLTVPTRNPR